MPFHQLLGRTGGADVQQSCGQARTLSLLAAGAPPLSVSKPSGTPENMALALCHCAHRGTATPAVPQTLAGDLSCLQSNTEPPLVWLPPNPPPSPDHLLPLQHQGAHHSSPKLTCTPTSVPLLSQPLYLTTPPCLPVPSLWSSSSSIHMRIHLSLCLSTSVCTYPAHCVVGRWIKPLSPSKGLWAARTRGMLTKGSGPEDMVPSLEEPNPTRGKGISKIEE